MPPPFPEPRPIILCPLRIEMKLLRRAGLHRQCTLACCGPGCAGVENWARSAGRIDRPIILAGLAGALTDHLKSGSAAIIAEVIDATTQQRWRPTLSLGAASDAMPACVITSRQSTVTSESAKLEPRARTGADLVDLESVAFAHIASAAGWRWGIVRGISDDLKHPLPPDSHQWVDATGRTRVSAVLRSILRRPLLVPDLIRLHAQAGRAMQAVTGLLGRSPADFVAKTRI